MCKNPPKEYYNITSTFPVNLQACRIGAPSSVPVSSKPFTLHQLVPLFSPSNLDEIEFQRIVSELACQEDSKTPPGNLIWSKIE